MPRTATKTPPAAVEVIDSLTPGELRHLSALEKRIERGITTFHEVGAALLEIRDGRLYRMTHTSFDAYCRERFSIERVRAYQLMGAATVAEALPDTAMRMGEAHLRPLVPIYNADPKAALQVWSQIEKTAKDEARPITVGLVREVVHAAQNGKGTTAEPNALAALPAQTRSVITALRRATAAIEEWPDSTPNRKEKKAMSDAVKALQGAIAAAPFIS